ncbi:MAG: NAD(P)H-binding protein [Gemmatimonadales bacterium]
MIPTRAIVLGGNGAVGSALVRELLAAPDWIEVTALVRRPTERFDGLEGRQKLILQVTPMDRVETAAAAAGRGCTVAFSTLGVGQPRTVSREELWNVDVGHTAMFAQGCRSAGVLHFSLLGAVGADPHSRWYYLKIKGKAEEAVLVQRFKRASFFRPSLLVTRETRYGVQDRITQAVFPRISRFLPPRFHEIRVEDLARAMRLNAERPPLSPVEVLEYPHVMALLAGEPPAP